MKPWTFKREAGWMMWLYLGLPAAALLLALVIPWFRRALGW
jgi:hypothetical protein